MDLRMPRFAANLAYLFTERPLIERFAAAAAAGFRAVELQLPYDHAPSAVKAELDRHGLTMLGINTAHGQQAPGEPGLPPYPAESRSSRRSSSRRSAMSVRSAAVRSIALPARCPRSSAQRPSAPSSAIS